MNINIIRIAMDGLRHRIGSNFSTWDCKSMGHYVAPKLIARHVAAHNFAAGHLRFIEDCLHCKRSIGYHCELQDGQIYHSQYDLDNIDSRREYFANVKGGKHGVLELACFCGRSAAKFEHFCDRHTIELLLKMQFQNIVNRDALVEQVRNGNFVASDKTQNVIRQLVSYFKTTESVIEFTFAWAEAVSRLKVVKQSP